MLDFFKKKEPIFEWKVYNSISDLSNKKNNDIEKIFNGRLIGMTLRNALSLEHCDEISKHFSQDFTISGESDFGRVIGKQLDKEEKGNFQKVKQQGYSNNSRYFKSIFLDKFNIELEKEITLILSKLSSTKRILTPKGYPIEFLPATIRICYPDKGGIFHHVGNEFILKLPESAFIKNDIILNNQLSFFFVIQAPESGGELVVYPKKFEDYKNEDNKEFIYSELEELPQLVLKPKVGDLIIFQGGNIWHKVADVKGRKDRITLGGIISYNFKKDTLFYWS
jgi:hypothetical protein